LSFSGLKLVGSAQRRFKGAFLQQGSILLDNGYLLIEKFLKYSSNGELKRKSITLKEILGEIPRYEKLVSSLKKGFEEEFLIIFKEIKLDGQGRLYEPGGKCSWTISP
ncbi:MAG: hypothetical protein ACPL6C_01670, partial [bacterium]